MLAVQEGKDGLAKRALARKQELDEYVSSYQDQWQAQRDLPDGARPRSRIQAADTSAFEASADPHDRGPPPSQIGTTGQEPVGDESSRCSAETVAFGNAIRPSG